MNTIPILIQTSTNIPLILPIVPITLMHKPHVVPTRLLVRRVVHRSPLDATMLRNVSPSPTVIHLVPILARRAVQSLDAVVVASDARSESRRVARAARLAVGERGEFGAELLLEENQCRADDCRLK
jgi:hypothetical protein